MLHPERGAVTFSSPSKTVPEVARSRPAAIFSKVDLPQPEGPSRQTSSLLSAEKEIRSSTLSLPSRSAWPYSFDTSLNSRSTLVSTLAGANEVSKLHARNSRLPCLLLRG